ncbi:MAG: hypothetical protein WBA13_09970 [Microcoleaceae cyanobacterium]
MVATLTGTVFQDADFDNIFNVGAGDLPLANVNLFLDRNGNGTFEPEIEQAAISDINGVFSFVDIPAGDVVLVQPGAVTGNTPVFLPLVDGEIVIFDVSTQVAAPPPPTPPVVPTGTGSIAGTTFIDLNRDGRYDPFLEPTRAGVEIYIDTNNDGSREGNEPLVTSNEGGFYDFSGLAPGLYVLRFSPGGDFAATTDNPAIIEVLPGTLTGFDFDPDEPGLLSANTPGGVVIPNSVYGFVVNDLNGDGLIDFNEPGVAGIEVRADGQSTTTGDDGFYVISGLDVNVPGANDPQNPFEQFVSENDPSGFGRTINVEFVAPTGEILGINEEVLFTSPFSFTSPIINTERPGTTDVFVVPGGSAIANATIVTPVLSPPIPVADSITGFFFNDFNGNGIADPGEPGVPEADIFIDFDNDKAISDGDQVIATDANGLFGFFELTQNFPEASSFIVRADGLNGALDSAEGPFYTTPVPVVSNIDGNGINALRTAGVTVAIGGFQPVPEFPTPPQLSDTVILDLSGVPVPDMPGMPMPDMPMPVV